MLYNVIAFFQNGEKELVAKALIIDKAIAKAELAQPWYDMEGGKVMAVPVEN